MKTKVVEYISRIQDGGAETIVKDYALKLDKDKFDVIVLCEDYKKNSANYKILISNNIKVISTYGRLSILCRILARIFGNSFISILFSKTIEKLSPDVLHIHLESLDVVYRSRNIIDGIKLFFTCHNLPELKIGNKNPIEKKACEYLLKNDNLQIFALHKDMANEINNMFNINNVEVMKNGIDFDRFINLNSNKKDELHISNDAYVVGNIGRFHYQKNHEFIIKVFYELHKIRNNSYLLLIGDGKNKNALLNLINKLGISKNVIILSNRNDIPELLNCMDVFLFPSRYEGLGIVLIEAQKMNLPCVVSDVVPNEAFQSNLITRLSLDDSLEKWVDSCLNPISNVNNYGNIDDYNINNVIKKLEAFYLA